MASYRLAARFWRDEGIITVLDATSNQLVAIPIAFMRKGHVDTFAFVYEVIGYCFEETGTLVTLLQDGEEVQASSPATAGKFWWKRAGVCVKIAAAVNAVCWAHRMGTLGQMGKVLLVHPREAHASNICIEHPWKAKRRAR